MGTATDNADSSVSRTLVAAAPVQPAVIATAPRTHLLAADGVAPYLDDGPYAPAGSSPGDFVAVAAVRRLLDESVAENNPRSSGAATLLAAATNEPVLHDIPDLLPGGSPLQQVVGPDGTLYQSAVITVIDEETGNADHSTTTVTKVSPAGGTPVVTTINGQAGLGSLVVVPDGTAYQTTYDQSTNTTTVTAISRTNQVSATTIDGRPVGSLLSAANGTVYQTTYLGGEYDPTTGTISSETTVTAITPTGSSSTVIAGAPGPDGLTVAADGTAFQTTTGFNSTGLTTTVTTISATGASETTMPGTPAGRVIVAPDGTAYQTTYQFDPSSGAIVTSIYAVGSTAELVAAVEGPPILDGLVVASDGTVYQTTYALDPSSPGTAMTTVTAVRSSATSTATMSGTPLAGVVVGPDGTAYQTTVDQEAGTTMVTTISPSGTVATSTVDGTPAGRTVVVAPDGTAYQTVAVAVADPETGGVRTTVTVMAITNVTATATTFSDSLPVGQVVIGPDGTAYLVTGQISYDPATPASAGLQGVVTSLNGDSPSTVATVDGMPIAGLAFTPDGHAWLVTRSGQPGSYDDRAWLVAFGAAGPVTPPTDTRAPFIRQLDRFVRAITRVPAAIARAAAQTLVRTMEAAAEAAANAVRVAREAAENARQAALAFGDTLADTFYWAASSVQGYLVTDLQIAKALGFVGPSAKLVARFIPFAGIAVSIVEAADGLNGLLNHRPLTGGLGYAAGLFGVAGSVFLVLPLGQPIGLGLLGISAGLSGASLLLDTFVPDIDRNVDRALQDFETNVGRAADGFADGVDTLVQGGRDFVDGVNDFFSDPKPPWEWKLW